MTGTNQGGNQGTNRGIFPATGHAAINGGGGQRMPVNPAAYGLGVAAGATAQGGSNQPTQPQDSGRKVWVIAISLATIILAGLLVAFGVMWFLGGDSQGARSACTKAAADLNKQYASLQEAAETAKDLLRSTDVSSVSDPQVLHDLKLKSQQAGKKVKPLACDRNLKQTQLAKNTSDMLATTEKLVAQLDDLDNAINALKDSQNVTGLDGAKSELESAVKTGEELVKQTETEQLDNIQSLATLKTQLDDAKRLLEQVNNLTQISDGKVSDLSDSMETAKQSVIQSMDAVKKDVAKLREEKARKEADEQLKQLEKQRLEKEREEAEKARQQEQSQSPSPTATPNESDEQRENKPSPAACAVGSTMTDPQGRHWKCMNALDPSTGNNSSAWVQDNPSPTPTTEGES